MQKIQPDFEELKRIAMEFFDAIPTLDLVGLDNAHKAFCLAF